MHVRTTLALGVAGGFLAFAGSALAAPVGPLSTPAHPPAPVHPTVKRAAATATNSTLYVNANAGADQGSCTKVAPCATIQYAIDQAPTTAKIMVSAGDYPEQLTIAGKNLSITGAGKTQTIIDPTSLTGNGFDPAVSFYGASATSSLNGVTVDATGVRDEPSCPVGVSFYDESGSLSADAVGVTSAANASYSCEYGVAAYDGDASQVTTFTMNATTVSDYGAYGVYCGVNSGSCTIKNSHVVGYGPVNGAQTGITLSETPTATLTADTVSGNADTGAATTTSGVNEGYGIYATTIQTLNAAKNLATGNDGDFYGTASSGAWTITTNSFKSATNYSSSPSVPNGSAVGDGLTLNDVDGATVTANTLTANADRGLNLFDVTDSTFGKNAAGKPNTISGNADDGIALTEYLTPSAYVSGEDTGNTFSGNLIEANGGDGIFAAGTDANGNAQQADNTFSNNTMKGNLRWDALDQSSGSGTDGTANTWTGNICGTSSPAGICPVAS